MAERPLSFIWMPCRIRLGLDVKVLFTPLALILCLYAMQENLQAWMADRRGRDQFAVRWGDETEVFWNDAARGLAEEARISGLIRFSVQAILGNSRIRPGPRRRASPAFAS